MMPISAAQGVAQGGVPAKRASSRARETKTGMLIVKEMGERIAMGKGFVWGCQEQKALIRQVFSRRGLQKFF